VPAVPLLASVARLSDSSNGPVPEFGSPSRTRPDDAHPELTGLAGLLPFLPDEPSGLSCPEVILRFPTQFVFAALAAAVSAAAVSFVAYVLLLPDFTQHTATGSIEPRWLLPVALCVSLVLSSFVAQRCLDWGPYRDSQLAASIALGALIGVLLNLAWSVRLLMTHVSLVGLVHAWSFLPLASAIGGTLLGHFLRKR